MKAHVSELNWKKNPTNQTKVLLGKKTDRESILLQ